MVDRSGQSKNLANPSKVLASGGKNLVNLAMITAGRAKKGSASAKYYSSPAEVLLLAALYTACVTQGKTHRAFGGSFNLSIDISLNFSS